MFTALPTDQPRHMPFLLTKAGVGDLTYEQLRHLPAPSRGVRYSPGETAPLDLLRALALTLPARAAYSHNTAAKLLALPLPREGPAVHVTVPSKAERGSRKAITWHAANIVGSTVEVHGLPCTDAARTWTDLGGLLPLPDLVAVADLALRRSLLTRDQLQPPKGSRGAVVLRKAAQLADPRSLSPQESIVRVHLHLAGLPAPQLNVDIIIDGGWIACADLAWPEYQVIVEYDGRHHVSDRQRHQDAMTRNELAARGWHIRVLTARHLRHMDDAVHMIAETLIAQGWNPDR